MRCAMKPERELYSRWKPSTAILYVCIYNVRTFQREDDLHRLTDEVDQIKWNVTSLCETYRNGEGLSEINGDYWMYEIGKTEYKPDAKGLAFQIHSKIKDFANVKTLSNRVIK